MSELSSIFDRWSAKYVVVSIELLILRQLNQEEMYGAKMLECIKQQLGTDVKRPTVYAILKRYETEDLIVVTREETGINTRGSSRKYFGLTNRGKQLMDNMIELQNIICHKGDLDYE